jgi:methionyl-tRNA formyltransferase
MKTSVKIGMHLMSAKGAAVLRHILANHGPDVIGYVVVATDPSVDEDGYEEIVSLAKQAGVNVYSRLTTALPELDYLLAVSWRWLINVNKQQTLVVFHDSLLPKYRGFAPLVSALINGDENIGVTSLVASNEYDGGQVIKQVSVHIRYPITIADTIKLIIPCYERLASDLLNRLYLGEIVSRPQDEAKATYSLWRDNDDYFIDWSWDAQRIQRFVDAVGYPYKGAAVLIGQQLLRIRACEALLDVRIENRVPGKVIFVHNEHPVVVCGVGLLKIKLMTSDDMQENLLPLAKFRTKFVSPSASPLLL